MNANDNSNIDINASVLWRQGGAQPSRAQKRRDAKAAAEAERDARIAEEQDAMGDSDRVIEERELAATLAPLGLAVRSIPVRSCRALRCNLWTHCA